MLQSRPFVSDGITAAQHEHFCLTLTLLLLCLVPVQPTLFKPGGLNFNMQQTAARTREGLAKMSLPFKLPGGGNTDGPAGS